MDLIERYLGAVRWNLPAAKADDIIAELADLIAARIEDREEALGRPLDKAEVSQILREFGHPLSVAGQYHGQRALIGADVFPFYWFILRVVLVVVAGIELVQIGGAIVVHGDFVRAVLHGTTGMIHSLLYNAAWVTLGFAVIERTGWLDAYLAKWKPEELPDLRKLRLDVPPRKRWEPLFEIGFGIAFLVWWAGGYTIPFAPHDSDVQIIGGPVWQGLYWPVVALTWARIALSLVSLVRPGWKPLRAALILGCTAGTLAIIKILHGAGQMLLVTGSDPAKVAKIQLGIDKGLAIAVLIVGIVTVIQCGKELYELYRERR